MKIGERWARGGARANTVFPRSLSCLLSSFCQGKFGQLFLVKGLARPRGSRKGSGDGIGQNIFTPLLSPISLEEIVKFLGGLTMAAGDVGADSGGR